MKLKTNPILPSPTRYSDATLFYRGPLFRTMAGYKLISGTFILCGAITVPALLATGDQGIIGAIAIGFASLLPVTLQSILVPRYVASITSDTNPAQVGTTRQPLSKPKSLRETLTPASSLNVSYFTLLGPVRTRVEKVADLVTVKGWRWINWKSRASGLKYYVDEKNASPPLKRVMDLVHEGSKSNLSESIEKPQADESKRSLKTIFSGIQPTGVPHIGNYLGALRNWIEIQETHRNDLSVNLIFSIVDLHAITTPQKAHQLIRSRRETLASLLAIGLDPERCIIYDQSSVKEHAELAWILSTLAPLGALSRMTQFKSKSSLQDESNVNLGLFAYPVLQAADILLYRTTTVPVGQDQTQHLELSRTLARSLNARLGYKSNDKHKFPLPSTLLSPGGARIKKFTRANEENVEIIAERKFADISAG